MKYAGWLCMVLFFCQADALAASANTITQKATGFGATPQEATANALVNAARQALGVVLAVDPDFRKQTLEWVVHQNRNGNIIIQRWSDAPEPRLPTLAGFKSYRVLSLEPIAGELWRVEVEARIARNRALRPRREALFSLAVLPFATQTTSYDLHRPVSAREVSRRLREALVESFTQSGQVRVLDRSHRQARLAEQLIAASSLDPGERAKLGHQLGADLLLTGRIERFQLGRSGVGYYGDNETSLALHARVQYRLIDVSTGDILLADTLNYEPPVSHLVSVLRQAGINTLAEPERLGEVIYPDVAHTIAGPVLNLIFPLQVLKVADADSIFVSQGKGRLAVGDTLTVVNTSQLTNPLTGANLSVHQPTELRLKVTQVAEGYAIARVSQGQVTDIKAGAKLVVQPPVAAVKPPTHPMTPGSSPAPISWE